MDRLNVAACTVVLADGLRLRDEVCAGGERWSRSLANCSWKTLRLQLLLPLCILRGLLQFRKGLLHTCACTTSRR
jgi:hypothetical protein